MPSWRQTPASSWIEQRNLTMTIQVARVTGIFISARAGLPMKALGAVRVIANVGLAEDRYALGLGLYSRVEPIKIRHLTLITEDGIATANEWQEASGLPPFAASDTRRNLVLQGISAPELNALVDKPFQVGEISCKGIEIATPCQQPSNVSGIEGFADAFDGRGGLRAQALNGGVIRIGDVLSFG